MDERLKTFFNYDEIFGTIVNRFITQAIIGYPLTVYGKGGQTQATLISKTRCSAFNILSKLRLSKGS